MPTWRVIPLLKESGSMQMAIDTWLFNQHGAGVHPPTIRFYTWSHPTISLGCHQTRFPQRWRDLTWQGKTIDLVRRPTGGRAVLHQGDLTYAIITSGLGSDRQAAYYHLCEFLIQGWRSLDVELAYGLTGRDYIKNPNCFGTATTADLLLENGAKFIGSAQLRRENTILQHGSMQLQPNPALLAQVFGEPPNDRPPLNLPWQGEDQLTQLVAVMLTAAQNCFQVELSLEPLTEQEWQSAWQCVMPVV